jgi:hypothetical protein
VSETIKYNSPIDKFYKSFSNYKWIIIPLILLLLISPINAAVTKTTTTSGLYTIESYTGTGSTTWNVPVGISQIDILIVGGGGGAGMGQSGAWGPGGGGAGGLLNGTLTGVSGSYTIVVGSGGAGQGTQNTRGNNGTDSSFGSYVAYGGGGGSAGRVVPNGSDGGSGGGGDSFPAQASAGSSTQTSQSPLTGYGSAGNKTTAGGYGGGATGVVTGFVSSITGHPSMYATGGLHGAFLANVNGIDGKGNGGQGSWSGTSGSGGSGTVIIRYLTPISKTTIIYGSYTIDIYNGSGSTTWNVPSAGINTIDYLVVAGGGGGGAFNWTGSLSGGGGGAGGMLEGSSYTLKPGSTYNIIVGAGGSGGYVNPSTNGQDSAFGNGTTIISATGGGSGAGTLMPGYGYLPGNGGSGGGNASNISSTSYGGTGIIGQGYTGGSGYYPQQYGSGGGGGAGVIGADGTWSNGGNGGNGRQNSITGISTYYAGGGGGAATHWGGSLGSGGSGGGGSGSRSGANYFGHTMQYNTSSQPYGLMDLTTKGTDGLGGGGGGGTDSTIGGDGGSGTVIIRYLTPSSDIYKTTIIDGLYTVDVFTGNGSIMWTAPPYTTKIDFLIVSGGGAGGGVGVTSTGGGGGGGGGYIYGADYSVTPGYPYKVIVGSGGTSGFGIKGSSGQPSSLGIIGSIGGGPGGSSDSYIGGNGSSGGGGVWSNIGGNGSTGQGYHGGRGYVAVMSSAYLGGGGGGASAIGTDAIGDITNGNGGNGYTSLITGSSITYGGGGGGCNEFGSTFGGGTGGTGGGGNAGSPGTNGLGGGGGGNASGGSGTVIIRYLTPVAPTPTTIPVPSLTSVPMPVQTYYNTTVYVDVVNSTYMQGWLYYLLVSNSSSIWDFPVIGFATSVMGPFSDAFTGLGAGNLIYLILWGLFIMMVWRQSGKITIPAMIAVITAGAWSLLIPASAQPWCSILLCAAIASQALTFFAKE